MKYIYVLIVLVLANWQVQAQVLSISPDKPERGQEVTITYRPGAGGAKIPVNAAEVTIVFTYSTFYDLPWKMPMMKKGKDWMASFVVQRYATFATFYIQSGEIIDQPAADKHFSLAVYKEGKRVKSSLLNESYSLGAQMPKSHQLSPLKLELQEEELRNYPDNYEAKVALRVTKMSLAKTDAEKLKYRNEARKIIAAKFEENPTFIGNVNLVTMGYYMIGEKTRIDSLRGIIIERFPNADISKDLRSEKIAKEKDDGLKIRKLEALLKTGDEAGGEGSTGIHALLFDLYSKSKDSVRALAHAAKLIQKNNPHTPETLKDIAEKLTANKIAPAASTLYAERALEIAGQWPVGIIRYFPEYGYIPSYVADSVRKKAVAEAKSALLSIIALNALNQGNQQSSLKYADEALKNGSGREGVLNSAVVYQQTGNSKKAFDALWILLLENPTDTAVLKMAKSSFLKFNASDSDFKAKVEELKTLELAKLKMNLIKQLLNKPRPDLSGITDLDGQPVTAEMMKGKVVVLDFWATWCVPCMQEMPYFHKVYEKYKNHSGVMFMVVNNGSNNTIEDAKRWAKQNSQYSFPVYFNHDKEIGEKVGFTVIPTIVVLDKNGLMQFRTIGFEGEILEKKLWTEIEILLNR